jgi:serine/threonine protein phosphatase PrpC
MIYVLEDQGAREYMEDRYYIEKKFFLDYDLYAVFDGHGGLDVSKFLQLYFKDILRNELFLEEKIPNALFNACNKMNEIIPKEMGFTTGSTALIVLQNPSELWVANIGDCRALINRGNEALQITIDHKPNLKSEYDRIYAAGGFVSNDPMGVPRVNGNLALSRSFGDFYLSPAVTWNPDIFHYSLFPECKYVFLASDGVYDVVQNTEIVKIVNDELIKNSSSKIAIRNACQIILQLSRSRGSGDNITIILAMTS